ncbi:hypothetical protein [Planococcus citreus]|uniref:Uncharacterized protein n=1 Tax=Planococcus citreus TaxID=1373 RepID=A0A497YGR6_9BACL|nr:hypothetical protein [Planococcus citreus]RLJ90147.1 hypothetical protein DFR62_0289 [Planococcus citreus]
MIDVVGAPFPNVLRTPECEYEQIKQRLLKKIEWLEEENAALKKENQANIQRGDQWRDEKLAQQKESDEIISHLREEVQRLTNALELHAEDEKLLFGLSGKLSQVGGRL